MGADLSPASVIAEAREKWDAVQKETRGVGVTRAGDFVSPPSHEAFERFVYRSFPSLVAEASTASHLRAALVKVRAALFTDGPDEIALLNINAITDTLWADEITTLRDHIDQALAMAEVRS